jgi:ketosteroid isomerase-like protein
MKNITAAIALVVGLVGCAEKKVEEQKSTFDGQAFAQTYFDTFNRHDWKALSEYYADDATFLDPSFGAQPIKQSKADFVIKYSEMTSIFPDLKDELKSAHVVDSTTVIVEFVSSGTGPDSIRFELPICSILKLKNGKIIEDRTYYDNF